MVTLGIGVICGTGSTETAQKQFYQSIYQAQQLQHATLDLYLRNALG